MVRSFIGTTSASELKLILPFRFALTCGSVIGVRTCAVADMGFPAMTEFVVAPGCKLGLMPENGVARMLGDRVPHPSEGSGIPRSEIYLYVNDPLQYFKRAVKAGGVSLSMAIHNKLHCGCFWGRKTFRT